MLRQKKSLVVLLAMGLTAMMMLAGCGSGQYGEIEGIISDQANITENYVNGLEKAENAGDVADVINAFTDGMKTLIPKIKDFQKEHPEFWNGGADVPENIKIQQKRLEAASNKVQAATVNMMKYMLDPKVQQAMQNMSVEMSKMQ